MPVRHALLAAFSVVVLGMCVYLFLEVRKPAPVSVASNDKDNDKDKAPPPESADRDDASHTDEATIRSGTRLSGALGTRSGAQATPPPTTPVDAAPEPAEPGKLEGPKLDAVMAEANKAYDKMDFDEARAIAQKVLKVQPANARMLRIMTSSHCIEADSAEAQKYYNLLPGPDREQMKTRCARYGITFSEPPAK